MVLRFVVACLCLSAAVDASPSIRNRRSLGIIGNWPRGTDRWSMTQAVLADTAADGFNQAFGQSVAISPDGSTMVVGAPGAASGNGFVHVLNWNATSGNFSASSSSSAASFHCCPTSPAQRYSLAFSQDSQFLLICAPNVDEQPGFAQLYQRVDDANSTWNSVTSFECGPDASGSSVALSADASFAFVGSDVILCVYQQPAAGPSGDWIEAQVIVPKGIAAEEPLSIAVGGVPSSWHSAAGAQRWSSSSASSRDAGNGFEGRAAPPPMTLAIGVHASGMDTGLVEVYSCTPVPGNELCTSTQVLTPVVPDSYFGLNVSIDDGGSRLAVGSLGAVYVYARNSSGLWAQVQVINGSSLNAAAADSPFVHGYATSTTASTTAAGFGTPVSMSPDGLVLTVGCAGASTQSASDGSAAGSAGDGSHVDGYGSTDPPSGPVYAFTWSGASSSGAGIGFDDAHDDDGGQYELTQVLGSEDMNSGSRGLQSRPSRDAVTPASHRGAVRSASDSSASAGAALATVPPSFGSSLFVSPGGGYIAIGAPALPLGTQGQPAGGLFVYHAAATPSATASATASASAAATTSSSATGTPTASSSSIPTFSATSSSSATKTPSGTASATSSGTAMSTLSSTASPSATATASGTATASASCTPTPSTSGQPTIDKIVDSTVFAGTLSAAAVITLSGLGVMGRWWWKKRRRHVTLASFAVDVAMVPPASSAAAADGTGPGTPSGGAGGGSGVAAAAVPAVTPLQAASPSTAMSDLFAGIGSINDAYVQLAGGDDEGVTR